MFTQHCTQVRMHLSQMIRTERLLHSHYDLQSVQEKVSMWLHCRFERGGCTVQLHIPNWKVDHGQLAHSVKSSQTANFVLKESSVQKRNDTLERSFVFSLRGWDDDDLKTTTTTTKRKRKRKNNNNKKKKKKKKGNSLVFTEDVPLVDFVYLVFTRMPGESYRKRFRSLL